MAADRFANLASIEVTMSAADTITFQELLTGVGISGDRESAVGMKIDEIDFYPGRASFALMTTAADHIFMGLTVSNNVTDLDDITDRRILATASLTRVDLGVAASGGLIKLPIIAQFFPPIITAERRIYLGCSSVGLASAITLRCRIYYRREKLTKAELLELAETHLLVG